MPPTGTAPPDTALVDICPAWTGNAFGVVLWTGWTTAADWAATPSWPVPVDGSRFAEPPRFGEAAGPLESVGPPESIEPLGVAAPPSVDVGAVGPVFPESAAPEVFPGSVLAGLTACGWPVPGVGWVLCWLMLDSACWIRSTTP